MAYELSIGFRKLCPKCGEKQTKDGHDACLGCLPGVMNACCGHGNLGAAKPYVQFLDGKSIHGTDAQIILGVLKRNKK